jgi:hypothetical protein
MEICVLFVWSWGYYEQTNNTHTSMEILSHSTHMIKQTMQTFPWRYYLIMPPWTNNQYKHFHGDIILKYPHYQTNNTHTSMEVLSHSTHMIKQPIQTFPWGYYLIIPPWSNKQYKHFHGGINSLYPHDQTNNTNISEMFVLFVWS